MGLGFRRTSLCPCSPIRISRPDVTPGSSGRGPSSTETGEPTKSQSPNTVLQADGRPELWVAKSRPRPDVDWWMARPLGSSRRPQLKTIRYTASSLASTRTALGFAAACFARNAAILFASEFPLRRSRDADHSRAGFGSDQEPPS